MPELTVGRLRDMLGRAENRAATAERQMRAMSHELTRLRAEIAALKSLTAKEGE